VSTTWPATPYASPTVFTFTLTPLRAHSSRAFCRPSLSSKRNWSSSTEAVPCPRALSTSCSVQRPAPPSATAVSIVPAAVRAEAVKRPRGAIAICSRPSSTRTVISGSPRSKETRRE